MFMWTRTHNTRMAFCRKRNVELESHLAWTKGTLEVAVNTAHTLSKELRKAKRQAAYYKGARDKLKGKKPSVKRAACRASNK